MRQQTSSVLRRCATLVAVAGVVLSVVFLTRVPVAGQAAAGSTKAKWTPPRTPDGQPDLQGVWGYATITPLERPTALAGKAVLSVEEAAEFERQAAEVNDRDRRDGAGTKDVGNDGRSDVARAYNEFWWDKGTKVVSTRQTALIVDPPDGRIPAYTPEGERRARARGNREAIAAGPEERGLGERCINWGIAGPPMIPGAYNNNVQLFQTPGYVVIFNEMIHDARVVPLDGRSRVGVTQLLGDSRGRWEGDTLVVETINFTPKTAFRGSSESLTLVEKFTRVSPDALHYEFTVNDPKTWTKPWTAVIPMSLSEQPIYEYACHEGNYGLVGILAGARADERALRGGSK